MAHSPAPSGGGGQQPLVVSLNCLDDPSLEQEGLAGVAAVEHVPLSAVASGRVEAAAAVLLPSLAFLPRAAQRRLRPWQLLLCLGSADRAADAAVAADLGLRLVHVDANRAEEVADTVMALILGLLRRTHLLSRHASSAPTAVAAGWLGSVQPMCRGMRRCRGLVLGIIGRSAAARCLATRSLAFRMSVLYFDPRYAANGKTKRPSIVFPSAARRMDTLNDLLAASDLVSLHCALTNDTVHILNADCLQHIKPGAFIVNTGSCQLIDDCALKQLLIDGTIAGCALDGAEGPQWMEAWVREMPNVLILPRSADYSEEVWMEIREKALTMLLSFFYDGVVPSSAISDEDEEISEAGNDDDHLDTRAKDSQSQVFDAEIDESHLTVEYEKKRAISHHKGPQSSGKSVNIVPRSEGRRSRSGKKGKKRPAHRRSQQKPDDLSAVESDSNYSSRRDDDTAMSGRDQVVSSSSRFASPEDSKYKQKSLAESPMEITSEKKLPLLFSRKYPDKLKDGFVVALRARDNSGYHVARQRVVGGGGWILDVVSNATNRDPAAQFLVTFKNKDTMGLRSFVAGGKLLQINRKTEFVFARHSFDVWESWMLDGSLLEGCRLINCRNPSVRAFLMPLFWTKKHKTATPYCQLRSPAMHPRNLCSVVFNLPQFLALSPGLLNKLRKDELVHQPLIKTVAGTLAELPWEILVDIFARLEVPDLVRAGSVCSSWNSAYTSIQSFGPYKKQQTPCLLYTSESAGDNVAHLYSLAEKRGYRLTLPAPAIHKRYLIGSSHGWLVTVDERSEMHLLNPITAEQIALPSVLTIEHVTPIYDNAGELCKYSYSNTVQPFARRPLAIALGKLRCYLHHKALVFLDDASAGSCLVVLIYIPYGQLAFARVGDEKWTQLPSHTHFQDCIYKDGVLYGVTSLGNIITIDLSGTVPSAKAITDRVCNHCGSHRFYIAEAPWGDLLQVWRHDVCIEEMGDGRRQEVMFHNKAGWMKIYKVCHVAKKLVQVDSLDGHVLFLGNCQSFCARAKDYPQLKPNHVYFTHDVEGVAFACEVGGGLHIGVLDYGSKSTEEIVWPRPWSNCLTPVFLIPNPRKMNLALRI